MRLDFFLITAPAIDDATDAAAAIRDAMITNCSGFIGLGIEIRTGSSAVESNYYSADSKRFVSNCPVLEGFLGLLKVMSYLTYNSPGFASAV